MTKSVNLIYLEENPSDAELVRFSIEQRMSNAALFVAHNKILFCDKLASETFDVILMDYDTPDFPASEVIHYLEKNDIHAPIIVVSGPVNHDTMIELIKQGAHDFVLKDNLINLPAIIARALAEHEESLRKNTDEKTKEDALKLTQAGVFKTDAQGHCLYVNTQLETMLGYTKTELAGDAGWIKYLHEEDKATFIKAYYGFLEKQMPFELEGRLVTATHDIIWVKCSGIPEITKDKVTGFIGTLVNISSLKKTQDDLRNLSLYDPLTGLPNRRYFANALQQMIEDCKHGLFDSFAVLYVDLDHFKTINDTLGHKTGDELLKQAAKRFKSVLREGDLIARIGGDEFLIILKNIKSVGEIAFVVDRFLTEFRVPFSVRGNECLTTLSVGVVYVDHIPADMEVEHTIQQADQALYRAKARGRNCYELYTEKISHEIQNTLYIEKSLAHAIEKNELSLYFQPEIDLKKNKIMGFEVLMRWEEKTYGVVSPAIFIPIAEETGQIHMLGEWIIDHAFKSYREMKDNIHYFQKNPLFLSINVSPVQLQQDHFFQQVKKKINLYHVPPENIIFEITETAIIQNFAYFKQQIHQLVEMGARVAIDDFGTGYSSFTNLKELPVAILKMDKSFVEGIESDNNCRTIIKSAAALAKEMGLEMIAEGIENKSQVDFLMKNGCHIVQGFYYSKPMPENKIKEFVSAWEKGN